MIFTLSVSEKSVRDVACTTSDCVGERRKVSRTQATQLSTTKIVFSWPGEFINNREKTGRLEFTDSYLSGKEQVDGWRGSWMGSQEKRNK